MIGLVAAEKLKNREGTGEFMAKARTACIALGLGRRFGLPAKFVTTPALVGSLSWKAVRNLGYSLREFLWFNLLLESGVRLSPVMETPSERKNDTGNFVGI